MRRNAKRQGLEEEVYTVSAYEKLKPHLLKLGISEEIADYLVQAGSETGHNSLKDFITVDESGVVRLVEGKTAEKIVHLADDMTFTSTPLREEESPVTLFLTPWERMLASRFIEKYGFMWEEGLGVNASREIVTVEDIHKPDPGVEILGSYAELQKQVAHAICLELRNRLEQPNSNEPDNDLSPEEFIKRLINAAL